MYEEKPRNLVEAINAWEDAGTPSSTEKSEDCEVLMNYWRALDEAREALKKKTNYGQT